MNKTDAVSAAARRSAGVLQQRDFRLLWVGETTSSFGSSVTSVALPLIAVVVLKVGTFAVGLLAAAVWLPWLIVGLPAGAWVDRMRKRPVMVACDLLAVALYASIPVAAWLGVLTLAQLLVVAVVGGTAAVFFTTAFHAYVPEVLHGGELLRANATLQGGEAATRVLGRGAAGFIAQTCGAVVAACPVRAGLRPAANGVSDGRGAAGRCWCCQFG